MIKKIDVIWHYHKDDKKFLGDYWNIEVFIGQNKILEYGDDYHDKGQDKVNGFIDGVKSCGYEVIVNHKRIADIN